MEKKRNEPCFLGNVINESFKGGYSGAVYHSKNVSCTLKARDYKGAVMVLIKVKDNGRKED